MWPNKKRRSVVKVSHNVSKDLDLFLHRHQFNSGPRPLGGDKSTGEKANGELRTKEPSWVIECVKEYLNSTSLHGLQYVGSDDSSTYERVIWLVCVLASLGGAIYFITALFQQYAQEPVIMSLSPTPVQLDTIPFPAITICNVNNILNSKATEILMSGTEQEKLLVDEFCNGTAGSVIGNGDRVPGGWDELKTFILNVTQPCYKMLTYCSWHGVQRDCSDLFAPLFTDEGMCCSFNKVKSDYLFLDPVDRYNIIPETWRSAVDWTPEDGYPHRHSVEAFPWIPWGSGADNGLSIVLDTNLEEYFCTTQPSEGFKIMIHNPIESPRVTPLGSAIAARSENRINITPEIMNSSAQVGTVPRSKRMCYFDIERQLQYFRTYTELNCLTECESNATRDACGCVLYYMAKDSKSILCGRKDEACTIEVQRKRMDGKLAQMCDCLPGCKEISYSTATTTAPLTQSEYIPTQFLANKTVRYFQENMAVVHFFFVDSQFTSIERGLMYGTEDLVSSTGGLLGLFLGCSVLSILEIIYFATIKSWRWYNRCKSNKTRQVSSLKIEI